MTDALDDKRDFFISYNKADRAWAEWVGAMLEQAGYTVLLDVWDFKGNFGAYMHGTETRAERTVALLSDNYFRSDFTLGEWAARYARDPAMREDRLIPVVVGPVSRVNLLDPILHADLFACGRDEGRARETLLERIARASDPADGANRREQPHAFPDRAEVASQHSTAEAPRFPVPLHNLPPQNPDFVGREDVLARLHDELLSQGQGPAVLTQAITGLGGIGKTQTALAYCYQHLSAYTVIWWLHTEQTATLAGQLGALAPHLGLDPARSDQAALASLVCDALARRGGFLLVFDSLEQPEVLPAFLPRTGGTVLITTRQRDWHGQAKTLPLEVMTAPEAVHLLTGAGEESALPELRQQQAAALAVELGHLPLALAQARDYMAATGETVAGYQALLVASRPTVLAQRQAHPDDPATVARTWEVSIRAAEKECPAARALLELLAFFAPEPLPCCVLAAASDALPEPLRDPLDCDRALAALTRFGLVTAAPGSLTVHRLVQAVTRDGLGPDRAAARVECAVRLAAVGWPSHRWDPQGWSAVQAVLPHALAAAQAAARQTPAVAITGDVLDRVATYFQVRGAYREATPLSEQAFAIGEKTLGPEHPDLANRLKTLADLYQDTGRYAEAEPLYQRAIAISEKILGPEHPDLAFSLNNLANLYWTTDRSAAAEPLFQRAIAILEKALGPEQPNIAAVANNLAVLYQDTGRYAEAGPLYQRSITISEKTLGPEHPDLAFSLNNLAHLYWALGRYAAAESLFQRSIAILEKTLPPEHPYLRRGRNTYAGLLDQLGRPAQAAALRAQAPAIR